MLNSGEDKEKGSPLQTMKIFNVFIEYDDSSRYLGHPAPAFSEPTDRVIPMGCLFDRADSSGKECAQIVLGSADPINKADSSSPSQIQPGLSPQVLAAVESTRSSDGAPGVVACTDLDKINRWLVETQTRQEELTLRCNILLDLMAFLADELANDRVRLVVHMQDVG